MLRTILIFGVIAGLVVVLPMALPLVVPSAKGYMDSLFTGYLVMILALSVIPVAIKRYRDRVLGGVIRFGPALMIGFGISTVAGIIYTTGWEISLAATHFAFVDSYSQAMVDAARAKGASPDHLAKIAAQMADFKTQYANPLYRLPMTFVEIFPVGVVVSLIAAGLLRNSRFLPARTLPI